LEIKKKGGVENASLKRAIYGREEELKNSEGTYLKVSV